MDLVWNPEDDVAMSIDSGEDEWHRLHDIRLNGLLLGKVSPPHTFYSQIWIKMIFCLKSTYSVNSLTTKFTNNSLTNFRIEYSYFSGTNGGTGVKNIFVPTWSPKKHETWKTTCGLLIGILIKMKSPSIKPNMRKISVMFTDFIQIFKQGLVFYINAYIK